jgi:hypothetical protein
MERTWATVRSAVVAGDAVLLPMMDRAALCVSLALETVPSVRSAPEIAVHAGSAVVDVVLRKPDAAGVTVC